ncbi:MAG TPA: beta-N-acetylglucosaminidase domain-containing protein [Candidatus Spyradenecus faecavium]|uniref:Beta-N-acetylglucosaminidase domain-containing protein n=1 Tax=Candidatus Spyradenecus faecavium TaxID=2840947 RepID=A0A9D1NPR6_9BACT|nr:beta-N-acetylglucosaminidase domain-containing protein [Candidatus Spyradenecus faecavium]
MRGLALALGAVCLGASVWAEALPASMRVWPTPQEASLTGGESFARPKAVALVPADGFDAEAQAALSAAFTVDAAAGYALSWTVDASLPKEGYALTVRADGATLAAADGRGFFYGVQTLRQLLAAETCRGVTVKDWPDVPFRGVVEGFYGQPWSFEARKRMFAFMGEQKMNTYIYGPKDDPYHGFGPKWRDPYPEAKGREIAELARVAHANKVNFVWAVHPGKDIHWQDDSDIKACLAKFELMYALGVRAFAVFFDDISGEGTRAEKQIALLNTLNREFVRKKGDVAPLIMCPTDYAAAWAKGTYLERLGAGLDPDIQVMWTGDAVCADITKGTVEHVTPRIRRKPFIWWNWPVCDYCKPHLLMGRCYGNDPTNGPRYGGFVSNPMDKPEASKVPLFGVAAYAWNPDDFDSDQAWRDSIRRLFPEVAASVQTLADHNSSQGPKAEGFNREESVAVAPVVARLTAALDAGQPPEADDVAALTREFRRISLAGVDIVANCQNRLFVEEVRDWADGMMAFGVAGAAATQALGGQLPPQEALAAIRAWRDQRRVLSERHAAKPFSEGIVLSSRVLAPYLDKAEAALRRMAER